MIDQIGRHRVKCGDVMNGIDDLMQGEKADFIYSDPPWGQGNLRYWQTINKRHTGKGPSEISYIEFLPHFFNTVGKFCKDVCCIEYGQRWREDLIVESSKVGFKSHGVFASLYQASKLLPLDIHVFSKSGSVHIPDNFADKLLECRGQQVVKYVFETLLPDGAKVVLDPMCGMGYTAQAACDNGLTFYGNELNEKRLEKTKARLRKDL